MIDPRRPVEEVISDIKASKVLLAEAMHGAIVADALRVPWIPIRAHRRHHDFKWHDWCASMSIRYDPHKLPNLDLEELLARPYSGMVRAAKKLRIKIASHRSTGLRELDAHYTPLSMRAGPRVDYMIRGKLIRAVAQRLPNVIKHQLESGMFEACCSALQAVPLNRAQLSSDRKVEQKTEMMWYRLQDVPRVAAELRTRTSSRVI